MTSSRPRAACLTPPAAGGIAFIQVVGADAARLLAPCLRRKRGFDLEAVSEHQLTLCRLVDGEETIDDVLIAVRAAADRQAVIDLNLHGGPRVVQRTLMLLRRLGVEIVEPAQLATYTWRSADLLEAERLAALLKARTRAVAVWVATGWEVLRADLVAARAALAAGREADARRRLEELLPSVTPTRYLLDGVRVVLIGSPNAGKSTLANALAQREAAIVSATPGTTRDWVEHPGAVDGIPFTFVDTAGLRETDDAIEREAIRRSQEQVRAADVVIHVIDGTRAPEPTNEAAWQEVGAHTNGRPYLRIWNKLDLGLHPDQAAELAAAGVDGIAVSAETGEGLRELRARLAAGVGLQGWPARVRPVTAGVAEKIQTILERLKPGSGRISQADEALGALLRPLDGR